MLPEGFEARMRALLGSEYEDFLASFDRPLCAGLRRNPLKTGFTAFMKFSLPKCHIPDTDQKFPQRLLGERRELPSRR